MPRQPVMLAPLTAQQSLMVSNNMGLVYWYAPRCGPAYLKDDLVQAGMLGLCRAVHKWDPSRGPFAYYAVQWIRSFTSRMMDLERRHGTAPLDDHWAIEAPEAEGHDWEALAASFGVMTPRQAEAVRLYYGVGREGPQTLGEAGKVLGTTREAVRQLVAAGLSRARKAANDGIER